MTIHWMQALIAFLLGTFFGGMIIAWVKSLVGGSKPAA